jgi:hypothetical protein
MGLMCVRQEIVNTLIACSACFECHLWHKDHMQDVPSNFDTLFPCKSKSQSYLVVQIP